MDDKEMKDFKKTSRTQAKATKVTKKTKPTKADPLSAEEREAIRASMKRNQAKVAAIKAAEAAKVVEHTVVSGDNLTAIAKKYYGDDQGQHWQTIYEANKEIIGDNPSMIRVGQQLQIPKLES